MTPLAADPSHCSTARLALVVLTALTACGGGERSPADAGEFGGTLVVSASADADVLVPGLTSTAPGHQVSDLLFDPLAEPPADGVDPSGRRWRPALAARWSWRPDSLAIAFVLDPRARWHDGVPVRSADVRFTVERLRDTTLGAPGATAFAAIDSVATPDSATAVLWFRERTGAQFAVAAGLRVLPRHLLADVPSGEWLASRFASAPVGTGGFRFARWDRGQRIEVVADSGSWRGRPYLDRVLWSIAPDPSSAALRVLSGEADVLEGARPDVVAQAAASPTVRATSYPSLGYGVLLFNLRDPASDARPHPILGDVVVRRAIGQALDRARLVRSVFDSFAVTSSGPVTQAQWSYDRSAAIPSADVAGARAALDGAGWRVGPDGVRVRSGRPLRLRIAVPASSGTRQRLAVLIQEALRPVGIAVSVDAMEFTAFGRQLQEGRFDAALMAWSTDPDPSGVRDMWSAAADRSRGGQNLAGYRSPRFDALVDSAARAPDSARAAALYHAAYATIRADAPAVWLYEPRNVLLVHRRVHPAGIRAEAWWAALAEWRIPAAERIARDRIARDRTASP